MKAEEKDKLIVEQNEKITALEKELSQKTEGLETAEGKIFTLETKLNKSEDQAATQKQKIASLETELIKTVSVNEALSKQIQFGTPAVAAISDETFEIDGKTVGFAFHKMNYKGQPITSSEVLASKDLQRELYSKKSGMLKY